MKIVRIALAQINTTVGDLEGNVRKIKAYINKAVERGADIVAFPELSITGYPPEDLLLKPQFIKDNMEALYEIVSSTGDIIAVVGFVNRSDDIYNAAAIIHNRRLVDVYHKNYLPNYGVFDEFRYFQTGSRRPVYRVGDIVFGVSICEDIWYPDGPPTIQALHGAELLININASPYHRRKIIERERMLSTRALDNSAVVCYVNAVGGQDELVFDGGSMVIDETGKVIARAAQFEEVLLVVDLNVESVFTRRLKDIRRRQAVAGLKENRIELIRIEREIPFREKLREVPSLPALLDEEEEIYRALILGTADYVNKNGFKGVLIGLSGGIDSSLVAAIAVDALGKERVTGVFMPSQYTSSESREDVEELVRNLDIKLIELSITDIFGSYIAELRSIFKDLPEDVTEENIQARIRGNLLMALSNKFGHLVLTTGNKSELSVGYATLYGDMAGGFAVIKDVPKTMVYRLARWRNSKSPVIPERVFIKPPSAELRPGQKDTDTLPPYDLLDPVLKAYIEEDRSFDEIIVAGCSEECVKNIIRMVDRSEYKRRQSPPGIKITRRALGKDRRFPITNAYRSF
ncbi:MAG: NAD+ synthase [Thermodesulfovibrionales bacterium]|nr:NAD+ synthase [Thermodesulfovibrionales bacterium]